MVPGNHKEVVDAAVICFLSKLKRSINCPDALPQRIYLSYLLFSLTC